MNIRVLYFARLREQFGISAESIDLPEGVVRVGILLDVLRARGGMWAELLAPGKTYRVAVNQDLVDMTAPIAAGDEVAIFPPVTGG